MPKSKDKLRYASLLLQSPPLRGKADIFADMEAAAGAEYFQGDEHAISSSAANNITAKEFELAHAHARIASLTQDLASATATIQQLESSAAKTSSQNLELRQRLKAAEAAAQRHASAAAAAKAEADAVRSKAAAQLESAHQRLSELEFRLHMAGYGDTPQRGKQAGPSRLASVPPSPDVFAGVQWPEDQTSDVDTDDAASAADSEDTVGEAEATVRHAAQAAARQATGEAAQAKEDCAPAARPGRKMEASEERLLRSEIATLERKVNPPFLPKRVSTHSQFGYWLVVLLLCFTLTSSYVFLILSVSGPTTCC